MSGPSHCDSYLGAASAVEKYYNVV
jgi:hypothetical protein